MISSTNYRPALQWSNIEPDDTSPLVIGVLPGEGVGPEVVSSAIRVLENLAEIQNFQIDIRHGGPIGNDAVRETESSFPKITQTFCEQIFDEHGALFCGPGGARFVYMLREHFDLYCKFTPLVPIKELDNIGPVKQTASKGVDIEVVRENIAGLYFGEGGHVTEANGDILAYHRLEYRLTQINRILDVSARLASLRRGRLAIVLKAEGIPVISKLWLQAVERLRDETKLDLEILDIDNSVYQLIADAHRFDVIVTSNMFGDVLSDCGSLLLGSRGLSYSGNFGPEGKAAYQTGHGAAYDIAGMGMANPVGQLLSLSMMLEQSFGRFDSAAVIRDSIVETVRQGHRTIDMTRTSNKYLTTVEFTDHVINNLRTLANRR